MSSTSKASSSRQSTNPPPVGPVNNVQAYGKASRSGSTKRKPTASTIATQNEDAKYKAKYRELKKKVQVIEIDNDKLLLDVLKTKKNIQRMRLERAILYERLAALGQDPLEQRQEREDSLMEVEMEDIEPREQESSSGRNEGIDVELETDRQKRGADSRKEPIEDMSMDDELLSLI